jgi:glutamate synthase (NADPH/NADH) small chain
VERFVTDHAFEQGWVKPVCPREELSQSVGIVGAGPGGLAAAEELRRRGYQVHVYDRHDRVGGLLIYGIPGFKLEKDIVIRRWKLLEEGGIKFHLRTEVGRDVTFAELRARHDAVLVATGVYQARELGGPGAGLGGIVKALDFLIASNRKGLGDEVPDYESGLLNAARKHVVVIGGGDTAMDCVRTSVRQGAASVTCLYRRDKANMPGSMREVKNAEEEGVKFMWLSAPDASGRQSVEVVQGSHFTVQADLVIKALGFDPEPLPKLWAQDSLEVGRSGTLKINFRSFETSLPGVFAAGDIVRGASLVVWAVRDGRDAAAQIHAYLQPSARQEFAVAAE